MRLAIMILLVAGCGKDPQPAAQATPPKPVREVRILDVSAQPPSLMAVRDEGAAWRVMPRDGKHYVASVTGPRFSFVAVCEHEMGPWVDLRHVTLDDTFDLAIDCPRRHRPVEVPIRWPADDAPKLLYFKDSVSSCGPEQAACEFEPTTSDALVLHGADENVRGRILRSLTPTPGTPIDADASAGWPFEPWTLEVTFGPPGPEPTERYHANVCFETALRLGHLCHTFSGEIVAGTPLQLAVLRPPPTAWTETDCYRLSMWGMTECLGPNQTTVHVNTPRPWFEGTYDRTTKTLAWPDDGGADAVEIYLRDYPAGWRIMATRGWLGGTRTYTIPSLRDVPGWSRAWERTSARIDVDFRWSKTAPLGSSSSHHLWSRLRTGDRVEAAGVRITPGEL